MNGDIEGETVDFIVECTKGVKKGNPSAAVGHNSLQEDWEEKCLEIEERTGGSDYIGLDLYDGTWSKGGPETYITAVNRIYDKLHLPVIVMEFGFASRGEDFEWHQEEVDHYLHSIGFKNIDEVKIRIGDFAKMVPEKIGMRIMQCVPEDRFSCAVNLFPHVMKKWPCKNRIPHSEEGQAQFYKELLPMLIEHPYVAGSIIYSWKDSPKCFACGMEDCPCETAWGLLRNDKTLKPAYNAVKLIWTGK